MHIYYLRNVTFPNYTHAYTLHGQDSELDELEKFMQLVSTPQSSHSGRKSIELGESPGSNSILTGTLSGSLRSSSMGLEQSKVCRDSLCVGVCETWAHSSALHCRNHCPTFETSRTCIINSPMHSVNPLCQLQAGVSLFTKLQVGW